MNLLIAFLLSLPLGNAPKTTDYYALSWTEFYKLADVNKTIDRDHVDYTLLNAALFHATNEQRAKNKMKLFVYSAALERAATGHSQQMLARDFFDHTNTRDRKNRTFDKRIHNEEPNFMSVGENISKQLLLKIKNNEEYYIRKNGEHYYYSRDSKDKDIIAGETYLSFAQKTLKGWMNSPGHRRNILDKDYTHCGCGTATPPNMTYKEDPGHCLVTQDFGAY